MKPATERNRVRTTSASSGCQINPPRAGRQPRFDQQRGRPHEEQRVERRVDDLGQPQDHLDKRHDETRRRTGPTCERTVVFGSVTMKKMKS